MRNYTSLLILSVRDRCGAPIITQMDWLLCLIYETVVLKTVFHGDCFIFL